MTKYIPLEDIVRMTGKDFERLYRSEILRRQMQEPEVLPGKIKCRFCLATIPKRKLCECHLKNTFEDENGQAEQ